MLKKIQTGLDFSVFKYNLLLKNPTYTQKNNLLWLTSKHYFSNTILIIEWGLKMQVKSAPHPIPPPIYKLLVLLLLQTRLLYYQNKLEFSLLAFNIPSNA